MRRGDEEEEEGDQLDSKKDESWRQELDQLIGDLNLEVPHSRGLCQRSLPQPPHFFA